jgi:putative DNA primase/helicase
LGTNSSLSKIISVQNGILDWRSRELRPWDNSLLTTIRLPVSWDPSAKCALWEQALREWIPESETRLFLQEYIGLCLIPDTSYRTAVFLFGSGSNGKSLFIEAVEMLFGNTLVSIPLHKLTERFEIAYLQNKLVNICGDVDAKYMTETGVLKALIGGDILRGEYKNGKSFDFRPVCRLLFSANTLPKVADKSIAWYSRWRFVEFPNRFSVDPNYKTLLLQAFEEEKSGILTWAVEGLCRLQSKNIFTSGLLMEQAEAQYRSENDNVVSFAQEILAEVDHTGAETSLITTALHSVYKEWCEQNGIKSSMLEITAFSTRLTQYGFSKAVRTKDGRSYQCFLGIAINADWLPNYLFYESLRMERRGPNG